MNKMFRVDALVESEIVASDITWAETDNEAAAKQAREWRTLKVEFDGVRSQLAQNIYDRGCIK